MEVWTVFVPYQVFSSPDGFLFGCRKPDRCFICVTHLSEQKISQPESCTLQCVGVWKKQFIQESENSNVAWISLSLTESGQPVCSVVITNIMCTCTCIIYDPEELLQSFLLTNKVFECRTFKAPEDLGYNFDFVINSLLDTEKEATITLKSGLSFTPLWSCGRVAQSCGTVVKVLSTSLNFVHLFGFFSHNSLTRTFKFLKITTLGDFLKPPAVVCELSKRFCEMHTVFNLDRTIPERRLRFLDVGCRQVLDTVFGVMLMVILTQFVQTNEVSAFIISWAESVADQLNILLNWLMGAPAGLKLNSQLTHFLGQFFLYHIYLWTGYLSLLRPFLGSVLWYTSLMGVFGLSVQLCLLQDILSMMTLHIYCFYVYAARLYRLQTYTLSSLWRLVRGKKWNILRHRVDSAPYDVDQLFLGTLLFTIFLFLLPTTALYYVVFTMLRMVVLVAQGILTHIVGLLSSAPVCSVGLWIVGSKKITGDVVFSIIPTDIPTDCLYLSLQTTQMPLSHLISLRRQQSIAEQSKPQYSWGTFLSRLMTGHLIYPWIDLEEIRDDKDKDK